MGKRERKADENLRVVIEGIVNDPVIINFYQWNV